MAHRSDIVAPSCTRQGLEQPSVDQGPKVNGNAHRQRAVTYQEPELDVAIEATTIRTAEPPYVKTSISTVSIGAGRRRRLSRGRLGTRGRRGLIRDRDHIAAPHGRSEEPGRMTRGPHAPPSDYDRNGVFLGNRVRTRVSSTAANLPCGLKLKGA